MVSGNTCAKNVDPKGTSKVFDEQAGRHEATNKKGANEAEEIVSIIGRFLVLMVVEYTARIRCAACVTVKY
jgi:hypothetical protein